MSASLVTDRAVREAYESDASGLHLLPDAVARPHTAEEVAEILREAQKSGTPVTAAGGQTSTTGASIAERGILLSLRSMSGVLDIDAAKRVARMQPGAMLGDVKRAVASEGLLFPPDPTSEDECTIGGAIACNASGARTLRYGATRRHVRALRVALADGTLVEVRRSDLEKNTVGYAFAHDPIDWFIGSEGTLGVIVEAEVALIPAPQSAIGLALPFPDEGSALAFIIAARESTAVSPRCLEYFDAPSLALARTVDDQTGWAATAGALVYTEEEVIGGTDADLDAWIALADAHGALADVRAFQGDAALRHARHMRHAVPATMNERGAACRTDGGRKVSTDWAVPYRRLAEALSGARAIAERHDVRDWIAYGHAGNGHPHQNFIARDADELRRIEAVVEETLRLVLSMDGTIAAEHGIGKIKRAWLPLQTTPLQSSVMRAVKRELDPRGILAPGNIF